MAEDQLGPKSPMAVSTEEHNKLLGGPLNIDAGASRRIRPGTKSADICEGPPLVDMVEIESAFQLSEHIKAVHETITHPSSSDNTVPVDRASAIRLAHAPDGVNKSLWLYELCRFLTQKANIMVTALFSDDPPCSAQTCSEMRASEWQYLCAVHDPPKSCCAIDYCCHTLDWAAQILTSAKSFPSRLALGGDYNTVNMQVRHITNIFRRVYRIFAHAWFQHREVFWKVENRTGLYVLFKSVCDAYQLIPEDNYTIPPEAEGIEVPSEEDQVPVIPKSEQEPQIEHGKPELTPAGNDIVVSGHTTKRHRHTPSSSNVVATVIEENEEEEHEEKRPAAQTVQTSVHVSESTLPDSEVLSDTQEASERSQSYPKEESKSPEIELETSEVPTENIEDRSTAIEESTQIEPLKEEAPEVKADSGEDSAVNLELEPNAEKESTSTVSLEAASESTVKENTGDSEPKVDDSTVEQKTSEEPKETSVKETAEKKEHIMTPDASATSTEEASKTVTD
ncbi:Mob1/phocein [Patellaria atrata CBS 101060]|uniref:Mob1/phocein n=1 Tax=Patellaria atrata CBS 101060 TaxID=1346257 RepID=A0A9P4S4I8_9PEZI|nr:Mob1/phocein [Patellaria atrata CBS 101060]